MAAALHVYDAGQTSGHGIQGSGCLVAREPIEIVDQSHEHRGKLRGQTHGLKDKTVKHIFRLSDGKVTRFDIQDAA